MKTIILCSISLLIGSAIGWSTHHHRAQRHDAEIIQEMLDATESADREHALRATRAIQLLDSGKTQNAVHLLCTPVAHYYETYEPMPTNDGRTKLRSLIEQLARSNPVVALQLAEEHTNHQTTKR